MAKSKTESKELELVVEKIQPSALELVRAQYGVGLAELRKYWKLTSRVPDEIVEKAMLLGLSGGIPLWGIDMIPMRDGGIKPYINANGVRFRVMNDVREVSHITTELVRVGTELEEFTVVKGEVFFKNGEHYPDYGAVMIDKDWNPANALKKAETQSERRAGYKAIGGYVGLPLYDEDNPQIVVTKPESGIDVVDVLATTPPPSTIGQLNAWLVQNKHPLSLQQLSEYAGLEATRANVGPLWQAALFVLTNPIDKGV